METQDKTGVIIVVDYLVKTSVMVSRRGACKERGTGECAVVLVAPGRPGGGDQRHVPGDAKESKGRVGGCKSNLVDCLAKAKVVTGAKGKKRRGRLHEGWSPEAHVIGVVDQ